MVLDDRMASLRSLQLEFLRRFNRAGRDFPSGRVTSYVRSPAKNRAVGGAPQSQHLYGLAADVVVPRAQWSRAKARLRAEGLIVIDEGDHLHAQLLRANQLQGYLA